MTTCSWCGANAEEKAAKFEGPHATWCVHFRSSQRGGPNGGLPRGLTGNRATLMIADEIGMSAKALEDQLTAAMFGPVRKQPQTALRVRGGRFETVELDDAGNVVEPPRRCCYGTALHAPNCTSWGVT